VDGVKGASGSFCVDAYEVSVSEYLAFLGTNRPRQEDYLCNWNTSYAPSRTGEGCGAYDPSKVNPAAPIACVDWCDARAYCEAAGKRLCGNIDAAKPTNPLGENDFATSEWYVACSAAGAKVYPYGNAVDVAACVDRASSPQDKNAARCEGGYPGIHHMSGNVAEWDNTCESGPDPKADGCRARGGAFWAANDPAQPDLLRCDAVQGGGRSGTYNDRGFRCCKTP
jgi:formylglycine-generating enzyme required for sulfatase activity